MIAPSLLLLSLLGQSAGPVPAIGLSLTLEVGQEFELAFPRHDDETWSTHDYSRAVLRQTRLPDERGGFGFVARAAGKTTIRMVCGKGTEPRARVVDVTVEVKGAKKERECEGREHGQSKE